MITRKVLRTVPVTGTLSMLAIIIVIIIIIIDSKYIVSKDSPSSILHPVPVASLLLPSFLWPNFSKGTFPHAHMDCVTV